MERFSNKESEREREGFEVGVTGRKKRSWYADKKDTRKHEGQG